MREALEVNREEMISLHSLFGLDFMFYLGFFVRVMAYVLLYSLIPYHLLLSLWFSFILDIMVCLGLS